MYGTPIDRAWRTLGGLAAALVAALVAAWILGPGMALAQEAKSPRFAIIDVQSVLRTSTAVKGLNAEVEKRRNAYQEELRRQEEELRTADQELSRQRTILSADVFATKRRELQRRVATLQREVQDRKRRLDQGFSRGLSRVQAELAEIAKGIAEEMGLDLILSKATVVIVKPEFELTEEASKRLNQRLPAVTVEFPDQ